MWKEAAGVWQIDVYWRGFLLGLASLMAWLNQWQTQPPSAKLKHPGLQGPLETKRTCPPAELKGGGGVILWQVGPSMALGKWGSAVIDMDLQLQAIPSLPLHSLNDLAVFDKRVLFKQQMQQTYNEISHYTGWLKSDVPWERCQCADCTIKRQLQVLLD